MVYSEGPDKGHAWVIAIAGCIISTILSGISKMVGILYVAVIDTYGVSRQQAILPFTFRKSFRCLAGPIVGIIGQRYGVRSVTIGGAVLASVGAGLCFTAPTITWLTFFWGGLHGLGDAFAVTLFQVVVNQYFEIYRSTASGIALSGACIGSVCWSFLIEVLIDTYSLQGMFLIVAAIILHVIPAAILLKSPSWIETENKPMPKSFNDSIKERPRMYLVPDELFESITQKKHSRGFLNCTKWKENILSITKTPLKSYPTLNSSLRFDKLNIKTGFDDKALVLEHYQNSDKQIPEKRLQIQNGCTTPKRSLYDVAPDVICDLQKLPLEKSLKEVNDQECNILKGTEVNDKNTILQNVKAMLRLHTNPVFLLICICLATHSFAFVPVMTCAVDYGKDKGLPESFGKYLIHSMALGDFVGRLCFGWVTDKDFISVHLYISLTLCLNGIILLTIPFTSSMTAYLVLLGMYAMTAGSILVRLPVLIFQHVKAEQHSIGLGCYTFASGLAPFTAPSIIGHFRDDSGSYDGMFYLMGTILIVSGAFWLLEPTLVKWNDLLESAEREQSTGSNSWN